MQELPSNLWSTGPTDVGLMKGVLPVKIVGKTEYRPKIKQYPLKKDAIEGIKPAILELEKAGIIIPCPESPCNTPIFPVKKVPETKGWRMIQDLRAVNDAVCQRAPNVPDPHTLLNSLNPNAKVFSVIDLSNAFWSIPLDKDSQQWFAFTFQGRRLTFTRLAQGFCESPTIFSEAITNCLADFEPPRGSQILIYVDDILIASKDRPSCKQDTLALLKYLADTGNKVNKSKLQLWKAEVQYLGHTLSVHGRNIQAQRKEAIQKAPKPQTKNK